MPHNQEFLTGQVNLIITKKIFLCEQRYLLNNRAFYVL